MSGVDGLVKAAAATTAGISAVQSLTSSGPASGITAAASAGGGITGFFSALFTGAGKTKLPVPNPLLNYASYTYQIGLGVLTNAQMNSPDLYMKGNQIPLILKDASASPQNRVKTPYGTFEFYIDHLEINSLPVLQKNAISNVTNITFKIIEPYSMGMFMVALQAAAGRAKHKNWIQAPYILTIDFRGNTESGAMSNIPNTSRKIPIKITNANMTVTEQGCVYDVSAIPWNAQAHSTADSGLKTNISISGKNIQEILQTGENSLQAVINKKLKEQADQGIVKVPDEVLILFPDRIETAKAPAANDQVEGKSAATSGTTADDIGKNIGVTRDQKNGTLVQSDASCNAIGKAKLGFSEIRSGDAPAGKEKDVWKENKGIYTRGNLVIDPTTNEMRFTQNMDIFNVINQVIMISDYSKNAMSKGNLTEDGQRQLWTIDAQVFNISSDENLAFTGMYPRLIVYRVLPYLAHSSAIAPMNQAPVGQAKLEKQVAKVYNYIYTGKNTDIIHFNIKFNAGFIGKMGQAKLNQTQDVKNETKESGAAREQKEDVQPVGEGNTTPVTGNFLTRAIRAFEKWTGSDMYGGGGPENLDTRVMRSFWDAVTSQTEMVKMDMEILGDPYYIIQSGMGSYSAKPDSQNLNNDGTMAHQNGQVFVIVNFRTPIDINLSTGLYDFGKSAKTGPVTMWTGLYKVTQIHNKFNAGVFTQQLEAIRLPNTELPKKYQATASTIYGADKPAPPEKVPAPKS
jgi:hypothetical protein